MKTFNLLRIVGAPVLELGSELNAQSHGNKRILELGA